MSIRSYIEIAAALLLIGVGSAGVISYNHAAKQAALVPQLQAQLSAAQASNKALTAEAIKRTTQDTTIRTERAAVSSKLDQVTHEDSTAGAYLDQRIPDAVRRVYTPASPPKS